jgi:hypothetical protein
MNMTSLGLEVRVSNNQKVMEYLTKLKMKILLNAFGIVLEIEKMGKFSM